MNKRSEYSLGRLNELKKNILKIPELRKFPKLTIYCAGSYARLEASKYSDIDLFFLCSTPKDELFEPKTSQIRLFSQIINIVKEMGFPKLSNDGEYLIIEHTDELIKELGSREDDYQNHFTARMLLLLESKCLYKEEIYNDAIKRVVDSYFRDYPGHMETFRPTFLINDIIRYWKTLCLNYEYKRNQPPTDESTETKQKVKDYKLKYSRMNTCFATIAALLNKGSNINQENIIKIINDTPMERLDQLFSDIKGSEYLLKELRDQYSEFLFFTGLSEKRLHDKFRNKIFREKAFQEASKFGDTMFSIVQLACKENDSLRYLVI